MPPARPSRRLSRTALVDMLAESLGTEKAAQVVADGTAKLGISTPDFDRDQALKILEQLATEPGLVGVVARFAKARVILASQ
jgi:hypothetical protein